VCPVSLSTARLNLISHAEMMVLKVDFLLKIKFS